PGRGRAGRIRLSERQRGAAAHRGAGHDGARPADMVHQLGEVVGELFDPVGALRLVGGAVAAAVVGEHDGAVAEQRDGPVPEEPVHAERMDEHHAWTPVVAAVNVVDKPRAVTQLYCRGHDTPETPRVLAPLYRARGRKPQAETSRRHAALQCGQTSRCMNRSAKVAALALPLPLQGEKVGVRGLSAREMPVEAPLTPTLSPRRAGRGSASTDCFAGACSRMTVQRKPVAFGDLRGWMAA